jgi:CopG antitoxin of type II toxin-antitoxin system
MGKKLMLIPKFRSEAEERRFWQTHDSSDYVDWRKAKRMRFPNLKRSRSNERSPPRKERGNPLG